MLIIQKYIKPLGVLVFVFMAVAIAGCGNEYRSPSSQQINEACKPAETISSRETEDYWETGGFLSGTQHEYEVWHLKCSDGSERIVRP